MTAPAGGAGAPTAAEREGACPYPGLEAFTAENRHFFFGRANDTQLVISNLYASPLTVVYGSSGVGKTSVILAGVVPEVEREGDAAILVHRTWQDAARSRSLGARLAQLVGRALGEAPVASDVPLDVLAERLAARWRRPIFLVFDQFEEYFLYNDASDEAGSLDGELARLINRRDLNVNVMIVLREDSLAALDRFRHRIPTLLNNLYRLEHLTAAEARHAIEEPLAVLRQRADPLLELPTAFEDGLAVAVLDDLASLDRAGGMPATARGEEARVELPFLQVVLERIWLMECRSRSPVVRRATFTSAGGARGIVRQRVQEALDRIDPEEREIVASVLRHLVTPSGAKIALTLADLAGYAQVDEARVEGIVRQLVAGDARVLRRVAHPTGDAALTKYEIYHDALGAPLQAWRMEMDRRRDESVRRAKRRDRFVRGAAVLLAVMVVSSILIVRWVFTAKNRVEARELATIASGQLDTDNGRALLLAMASIERSGSEQAGEAVLRRALFEPGERQRAIAPDRILSLQVSPDGRFVVGTGRNADASLWRVDSLASIELPLHIRSAQGASFDSAGHQLLIVEGSRPVALTLDSVVRASRIPQSPSVVTGTMLRGGDRALLVHGTMGVVEWLRTGESWREVARTPAGNPIPRTLEVSADERWVAWIGGGVVSIADRQLQPWAVQTMANEGGRATQVQFVSAREIAVANGTDTVRVFDVATREQTEAHGLSCRVSRFAFANGEAAGLCGDSGVVLFNLPRMRSQARMGNEPPLANRSAPIADVVLSPDGRLMLWLPKNDQVASIWSIYSRTEVARLRGHRGRITAAAFLGDSRHVLTAGEDSTLRMWEVVSAAQRIGDGEFMGGRASVVIDARAERVAMIGPYGLQLWDVAQRRALVEVHIPDPTSLLAITSAGDRVATLDGNSTLREYTAAASGERLVELPRAGPDRVNRAGVPLPLFDGRSLLRYAGESILLSSVLQTNERGDSFVVARLAPSATRIDELVRVDSSIADLAVDSAASRLAVAFDEGPIRVFAVGARDSALEVAGHFERATAVALAPNGVVASGGNSGDVTLSAPMSPSAARSATPAIRYAPAVTVGAHERGVVRLAFNRGATVLASGDEGGTVRLWSVSPPRELCSLEGQHADYIRDMAFAPSGRTIATADERGVALWFVDEEAGTCHFGYRLVDLESPTEALRFAPRRQRVGGRGSGWRDSALRAKRLGPARLAPRLGEATAARPYAHRRRGRAIHQTALGISFSAVERRSLRRSPP